MKRTLLMISVLFFADRILAQTDSVAVDTIKLWHKSGQINLTFSQVSLTNWAAGGENSFSGNGLIRLAADYKKNNSSWDNYLLAGYGLTKQGDGSVIKNDDKLELFSKYGYKASKYWNYSAVLNFRTQFTPGYKSKEVPEVKISDFLSPAYLTASLGMDYKPNDDFALFISPATLKFIYVQDDSLSMAGAYGVDPGKNLRQKFGGFIKMIYKKDNLINNVNLATTLDLFSNYLDHPERVDVNWDLLVVMKINKLLSVTVNTTLIYDYDIKFIEMVNNLPVEKSKIQFKEVLGLGLAFSF